VGRTHLAVTVELVSGGQGGNLWPRPGRVLIASRSASFEQLAEAIDGAFARWDRSHLHEFTLADGTPISPLRWRDGEEPDGMIDGSTARLGRLRLGEQFAYVFDLGDNWQHLCTVAPRLADPLETLGTVPDRPVPCGGGALSPTSTAAAGTATTAAPRYRPHRTGCPTSRRSSPGGDHSPGRRSRTSPPTKTAARSGTAT